jgi:hypothetical protein
MAIIFSIQALHLGRIVSGRKHWWQFKQDVAIESNQQELDFLQKDLVII